MSTRSFSALCLSAALLPVMSAAATSTAPGTLAPETLATVGTLKVTNEEFNRRLEEIRKQASNPPAPEAFLEDLVRFKMGLLEAERLKLDADPLVRDRYEQVLYNSLLERALGPKVEAIKITDNEMRDFYRKNPEVRLAHILIDVKENAAPENREAAKKRALEILKDVRKSKRPFEDLVKLYSDDPATKEQGGDIGYQSRVTLAPNVFEAAAAMRVGEVKGLIESRAGYHIVKLLDRHTYDLADKRQIRAALFDDKRAKIFAEYFNKLKKQYKVEIDKGAVKRLVK